jgi:hypothetical protein
VSIANNSTNLAQAQQEAQEQGDVAGENLATCLENSCANPCSG